MTNPITPGDMIGVSSDLATFEAGNISDVGTLSGTVQVPATKGAGLFQTTLTNIANWIVNTFQGFTQAGTGAVARTLQSKLQDRISLKDFGAKGDGVTDDTAAIQTFLTALSSGKSGYIPSGYYMFSSPLALPATFSSLIGTGKYSSVFVYTGANTTSDLMTVVGSSINALKGPSALSGFGIRSNTVMTGGHALFIQWAGHITTRDVAFGAQYDPNHNLWNGIAYYSTDFQLLEDFEIQVQNEGIQVSGGGAGNPGPQYDLWVEGGKISGCAVGIHIGGGWDNAYFDRMMVTFNGTNVLIDNALQNFKNQELGFGPQFITDQPQTGDNYHINDTLANLTNYGQIMICGPVTGSKTGNGVNVVNWPGCFINISSPYVAGNNQNGIYIQDASAKVLLSSHTNIVTNGQYGIAGAFANTTVVAPCTFSGNVSGTTNSNISNTFGVVNGQITGQNITATGTVAAAYGNFTEPANNTTTLQVTNTGSNGANVKLNGNGATTPNKTIRAQNGSLQVLNNGYTAAILTLDDAGDLAITGYLDIATVGAGLRVKEGANAKQGIATLVAGTVTVANTSVTANSRILYSVQTAGGTQGFLSTTRVAGTSFTINSTSSSETSVIAYEIFEPG